MKGGRAMMNDTHINERFWILIFYYADTYLSGCRIVTQKNANIKQRKPFATRVTRAVITPTETNGWRSCWYCSVLFSSRAGMPAFTSSITAPELAQVLKPSDQVYSLSPGSPHFPSQEPPFPQQVGFLFLFLPHMRHLSKKNKASLEFLSHASSVRVR